MTSKFATSFVGTVEYIAPEVLSNEGYAGSVDWWTLGIFMYEMLFGKTPFKGADARDTFSRIRRYSTCVKKTGVRRKMDEQELDLTFPDTPVVSKKAKDLIGKLLNKDNCKRLLNPLTIKAGMYGSLLYIFDVLYPVTLYTSMTDPWFRGIQWALLRCQDSPLKPKVPNYSNVKSLLKYDAKLTLPAGLEWYKVDEGSVAVEVKILESVRGDDVADTGCSYPIWEQFDYIRMEINPEWDSLAAKPTINI